MLVISTCKIITKKLDQKLLRVRVRVGDKLSSMMMSYPCYVFGLRQIGVHNGFVMDDMVV